MKSAGGGRPGTYVQLIWLGVGGVGLGAAIAVRHSAVVGILLMLVFAGLVRLTHRRLRRL